MTTVATDSSMDTMQGRPRPLRLPQWLRFDGWGALVLPLLLFLILIFVAPLVVMLSRSLTDPSLGLQNYRDLFANSVYLRVLGNTFLIATIVTAVTLALAYPYAYLMTLVGPTWRMIMLGLVLVPFWTSILVRSFALVLFLRDTGAFNATLQSLGVIDEPIPLIRTLPGVVFGMVQVALPFAVLPIFATMQNIDRRLLLAAESLGARPSGAFWRIFVPLSAPGVAAGLLLTFIQALGYYITPALLGGPKNMMIGELIVQQVSSVLRFGFAAALATLLLVTTLLLLLVASRFVDLQKHLMRQT
ncbi:MULTISPECIES: ABC transporter permease [Thermomonospora]|uniref:Binding-protein-dependent transport systems inner membrane component n=1 Tax=Thermomonospora curvata (strain ATCC 19995 / DSM 43183 / JCM 3096 / KCTC 9072 / NBRC 15933 / NCIMB 10081 / Henssen B9) TaxID=471852 RepID=D1A2M5_THECD|nr:MULTISPECIES: ABC transporter permease [Thermomonospora]ACY96045.1 binding-protein-dependent transport systems inner membrane component [Thermomonospora curvata DSM 43183]PKK15910.1 MAG: ABC transporter permease [Thermomonospora sp. CIF 1]